MENVAELTEIAPGTPGNPRLRIRLPRLQALSKPLGRPARSTSQGIRYLGHLKTELESATIIFVKGRLRPKSAGGLANHSVMEVLTPKSNRRSTRVRVEIPVSVVSLDRMRPFAEPCELLVVSAQGCGFRSARALPMETPIMIGDLPGGGSVTARVANCLSLGSDGKYFLIGVSLYTHGNVWGIADAPADWSVAAKDDPAPVDGSKPARPAAAAVAASQLNTHKQVWPYNIFSGGTEAHPGRK